MLNLSVREALNRYGPVVGVAMALLLLVAFLPGGSRQSTNLTSGSDFGGGAADGVSGDFGTSFDDGDSSPSEDVAGGAGTDTGTAPGSGAAGSGAAGSAVTSGGGQGEGGQGGTGAGPGAPLASDTECREDGNMPGFSHVSPPCVPLFTGDNGGSTSRGVSGDTIQAVWYLNNVDPVTAATLQSLGAADPREVQIDVIQSLTRYFNLHFETYKRAVNMTFYESSAAADDDAAHRAEAAEIATQIKPFAVVGAPPATVQEELAARGVVCVCSVGGTRADAQKMAPHVWGVLPHIEEYYEAMAEYTVKRLAHRPAKWAGSLSPTLRSADRKFGLIYIEGEGDPRAKQAADYYERLLGEHGVPISRRVSYTFDLSRSQEQATNIIVQMKSAGVSNVTCVCDPIYPIFLTQAATQQGYFPEWFIMGSLLTDTTFFGRTYDQQQWSQAFGISPLYVFWKDISKSVGYREYHHAKPGAEPGDEGTQINVIEASFPILWSGIHQAGPNLTPRTFAEGLFKMPARGGVPGSPRFHFSPDSYMAYSDFTEVFWHAEGQGKDETGKDGRGILLKTNNGRRYGPGDWPASDPNVFDLNGAVYTSDEGATFDHDADGHVHPEDQRCRSCG